MDFLLGEIVQSWEKFQISKILMVPSGLDGLSPGRNCPELGEIPNFKILMLSSGFSPGRNCPELGEIHFEAKLTEFLLGEIV